LKYITAASVTLVSAARQHVSDWVNNLYNTVIVMVKYFGSYVLLLFATLLGGGSSGRGIQSVGPQQYLLGLGIGDVTG
jgi:hypothetical protein